MQRTKFSWTGGLHMTAGRVDRLAGSFNKLSFSCFHFSSRMLDHEESYKV